MNMLSRRLHQVLVPLVIAGLLAGGVGACQSQSVNLSVHSFTRTAWKMPSSSGATPTTVTSAQSGNSNLSGLNGSIPVGTDSTVQLSTPSVTLSTPPATFSISSPQDLTIAPATLAGTSVEVGPILTSTVTNGDSTFANASTVTTPPAGASAPGLSLLSPLTGALTEQQVHVTAVPEPGSVALLIGAGVSVSAFLLRRRRA